MRLLRRVLLTLLVLLLLGVLVAWEVVRADFFWQWAGRRLVTLAAGECHCDVQVKEIQGNLFDGLFFNTVIFATPEGEVIRARSLEIKVSFWSLLRLSPFFSKIAVIEPHFTVRQEKDGEWNIIKIIPPPPEQLPVNIVKVRFDDILVVNGEGNIAYGGQVQEFTNLDLNMDLDLEHPVTPWQAIKVGKGRAAATSSLGRLSLDSRFSYAQDFIDVQQLEVKSGDQTLFSLDGKADLREGGLFQVTGEADLPGENVRRFWEKWPLAWAAAARFQAHGTRMQFEVALAGKIHELAFDLAGHLGSPGTPQSYDLQGTVKHLTPELLTLLDPGLAKKFSQLSPLEAKFHFQATDLGLPPARFAWNLSTGPWQFGAVKVGEARLTLAGDRQSQQLQGAVKSNNGQLALQAAGSLFSAREGKFTVQAEALRAGALGLGVPEGTALTAKLQGSFSSPGLHALDRLKVSGDLEASGTVGPHPLNKLQASLAWTRTKLEIFRSTVQLGNLTAELKGSLEGDKLAFAHEGKSGSGGNWPVSARLGGQFSWDGTLTGRLADPQIALKARGQGLSYERFGLHSVTLNAQTSGWPLTRGRVELTASGVKTPLGTFSQAALRSEGGDKLWSIEAQATGPEGARIEVRGGADLARSTVSLERAQLRLKNLTAHNLGPVVAGFGQGLEVRPVAFAVNQGRISLQARITDQEASGSLSLQDLPVELVSPPNMPLTGNLSGQATLAGSAHLPVLQGEVSLGPGRYQDFDFQSCRTSFNYRDQRLSLNGSLRTKEGGPMLTWDGAVPLHFSLKPLALAPGPGEIKIQARGDHINLALLAGLSKEVEQAQGAVRLQANLEGTISQPRVSGQVSWDAGAIKLRSTGATYQLQPGKIRLQGNRLTIPQLVLLSEGTATLSGEISLAGFRPDEVRTRVQVDNFKVIDKLGSQALISGFLNLDGRWPDLALKGSLTVPKASFRLSFLNLGINNINKDVILVRQEAPEKPQPLQAPKTSKLKEAEVWRRLSIDLEIQAPNNVWVDDRQAKIESSVRVLVTKRPGRELAFAGKIQALHGHVNIVGRQFQVVTGVVDLPAQAGAEPALNVRLEYEATDAKLYVNASGPVSSPKITLGGEPAISETDWMAYLLYGKPVGALSREEQSATMAAGAFGGLATQMILKDLLGLAPPLTKGLSISYQHRNDPLFRDDPYQVVINYRINRHFSVQSQVGGRNTGGDALFNYDF